LKLAGHAATTARHALAILSCRYHMPAAEGFPPMRRAWDAALKVCSNRRQAHLMIKVSV